MGKRLKDAIIAVLSITLITIILIKTIDFDYYLSNIGVSLKFNCQQEQIEDVNDSFILYEDGSLYYNDINGCKLIQENVKSFAKTNQDYVLTDKGIKSLATKQTRSNDINDIIEYEQAYNNTLNQYDKLINVNLKGLILKDNTIYYFDSIYIVNDESSSLVFQYNENENLKIITTFEGIENIYYSMKLNKLLVKANNKYYEIIIDLNQIQDNYELTIDKKFTDNYNKIKYINDGYMIYNNKIWEW